MNLTLTGGVAGSCSVAAIPNLCISLPIFVQKQKDCSYIRIVKGTSITKINVRMFVIRKETIGISESLGSNHAILIRYQSKLLSANTIRKATTKQKLINKQY